MAAQWAQLGLGMTAHMVAAMLLGWAVGYERYFNGRAAGSQVYCLVCTTSCTVAYLAGYPALWYGGGSHGVGVGVGDPTHVIGSILTGIGFLGAGIIVQTGLNVRGLTTAASIWGSAAIGILVGIDFHLPAIALTALFVLCMAVVPRIERRLPAHSTFVGSLRFREGYLPRSEEIHQFLAQRGMTVPADSLSLGREGGRFKLDCLIFASALARVEAMSAIAAELSKLPDVESFTISHSSRA